MNIYDYVMRLIEVNITYCLFPWILTILVLKTIFKDKFQTKQVLVFIRWFIIVYAGLHLIQFIFEELFSPAGSSYLNRLQGPYILAYWCMITSGLLPLFLIFKRISQYNLFLLFASILLNLGFYFERFVIVMTSLHRDQGVDYEFGFSLLKSSSIVISQGFIIGMVSLIIVGLIKRNKNNLQQGVYK
jgi:hypothetical protein